MIQSQTRVTLLDNTGVRLARCLRVYNKKTATLADTVLISIIRLTPKSSFTLKKGDLVKALLLKTKKGLKRQDGSILRFDQNSVILLTQSNMPIGTRLSSAVLECRKKGFVKCLALAKQLY